MKSKPHNKIVTPGMEQEIIQRYTSGQSARQIRDEIGLFKTHKTVYDVLKKYGIKTREWADYSDPDLRHDYFLDICTPNQAYLLGVIIADGYVYEENPVLGLQMADRSIIELMKSELRSQNSILRTSPRTDNHKEMFRIVVTSNMIKTHLARYGVVPKKTHITQLPTLMSDMMPHLLRGVLDGDGFVGRYNGGVHVGFTGSVYFVSQVSFFLALTLGISQPLPIKGTTWRVSWAHKEEVKKIHEYLYPDGESFCLARKREKFED